MKSKNIALIWDFDGTLTPVDSTSKTVEVLSGSGSDKIFWDQIKEIRRDKTKAKLDHILASDAPIWMYALARMAFKQGTPLNTEFFRKFVVDKIKLFSKVESFLSEVKKIAQQRRYKAQSINTHHFIVSAGLKDLIELCINKQLITKVFGCRYEIIFHSEKFRDEPESIPVFCMDETMKTRSIFEISKGVFNDEKKQVNTRVKNEDLWAPFSNIIYIGDGPTDIPSLSLVRDRGGLGVVWSTMKQSLRKILKKD